MNCSHQWGRQHGMQKDMFFSQGVESLSFLFLRSLTSPKVLLLEMSQSFGEGTKWQQQPVLRRQGGAVASRVGGWLKHMRGPVQSGKVNVNTCKKTPAPVRAWGPDLHAGGTSKENYSYLSFCDLTVNQCLSQRVPGQGDPEGGGRGRQLPLRVHLSSDLQLLCEVAVDLLKKKKK